jgi:V-type H+-transporting ATPase subunit F
MSMGTEAGLIAVIGDEDTVTGFLLTGIGERNREGDVNFHVVDPEKTRHDEIAAAFNSFTARKDVSIVLITQPIATEIRYLINAHDKTIPTIVEIPSKEEEYDESKDEVVQRVLKLLGRD